MIDFNDKQILKGIDEFLKKYKHVEFSKIDLDLSDSIFEPLRKIPNYSMYISFLEAAVGSKNEALIDEIFSLMAKELFKENSYYFNLIHKPELYINDPYTYYGSELSLQVFIEECKLNNNKILFALAHAIKNETRMLDCFFNALVNVSQLGDYSRQTFMYGRKWHDFESNCSDIHFSIKLQKQKEIELLQELDELMKKYDYEFGRNIIAKIIKKFNNDLLYDDTTFAPGSGARK